LDVGRLFGALVEQVRQNMLTLVGWTVALTASNLALDQFSKSGSFAGAGFMSLIAQYLVTRSALRRSGLLAGEGANRFGSFWGMNIITGLTILLGSVLLIIPGLYLAARWFIAGPAILAEDMTAGEGMRESWEMMKPSAWHVVGAVLLLYGCGYGLGILPLFFFPADDAPLGIEAISYLALSATSVLGWLMAVGTYQLVSHRNPSLAEVFA
jgi:hypothetical protein